MEVREPPDEDNHFSRPTVAGRSLGSGVLKGAIFGLTATAASLLLKEAMPTIKSHFQGHEPANVPGEWDRSDLITSVPAPARQWRTRAAVEEEEEEEEEEMTVQRLIRQADADGDVFELSISAAAPLVVELPPGEKLFRVIGNRGWRVHEVRGPRCTGGECIHRLTVAVAPGEGAPPAGALHLLTSPSNRRITLVVNADTLLKDAPAVLQLAFSPGHRDGAKKTSD